MVLLGSEPGLGISARQRLARAGLRLLPDDGEGVGRLRDVRILAVGLDAADLQLALVAVVHEARHYRRAVVLLQRPHLRSELHGDVRLRLLAADASVWRLCRVIHRQEESASTVGQVGRHVRLLVRLLCHRVRLLLVQLELLLMVERTLMRMLVRARLPKLVYVASSDMVRRRLRAMHRCGPVGVQGQQEITRGWWLRALRPGRRDLLRGLAWDLLVLPPRHLLNKDVLPRVLVVLRLLPDEV